jgi:uncharacterized protein DUF3489
MNVVTAAKCRERSRKMTKTEAGKDTGAAAIARQGAPAAFVKATAKKGASRKKGAPKAVRSATRAAPAAKAKAAAKSARTTAGGLRAETKGAKILERIGRPKGATLAELMKATGWQAHSVRGFISNAGRKNALRVESSKNEAGERTYNIAK